MGNSDFLFPTSLSQKVPMYFIETQLVFDLLPLQNTKSSDFLDYYAGFIKEKVKATP